MKTIADGGRPKRGWVAALLIDRAPGLMIFKNQVRGILRPASGYCSALFHVFLTYLQFTAWMA
jgi:hypothetical protein